MRGWPLVAPVSDRRWWALALAALLVSLAGCGTPAPTAQTARGAAPAVQAAPRPQPPSALYLKANGDIIALRSDDRAVLWRDATIGSGFAPPLLADNTLYVGSDALYTLDRATGARRWRTRLDSGVGGLALFQDTSGAARLIAVTGAAQSGSGGSVYGVRASDGALLWHVKTDETDKNPPVEIPHEVALIAGTLYVGGSQYTGGFPIVPPGALSALDPRTGATLWSYPSDNGPPSLPAVAA
jgi:outer membrane protein assembly factor BamB